jgi:uncharacterized protein YbjT (DUF2867 family)
MGEVLITGAGGRVGRRVARRLQALGCRPRLSSRRPLDDAALAAAPWARADFDDPASMLAALRGAAAVFLYTPAEDHARPLARAVAQAGIQHAVVLSSAAVVKVAGDANPVARRHRALEQALAEEGVGATMLRPDTFASNALQWAPGILREGIVRLPFAQAPRNPIHEDDIADAAVAALLEPAAHRGRAYLLTGPELLTQAEQVQAIARATRRGIAVRELSAEEALAAWTSGERPMPAAVAQRLLAYLEKSVHTPPALSADLERLTGCAPRRFAAWCDEHRAAFMPPEGR